MRMPGPPTHGRNADIVRILAAALGGEPPAEGAKQKVLIGDPDDVRADGVARLFRRVGFDVETVRTGRGLMRRLHARGDIDLVVLDRHIADPLLPDMLAQVRADRWGKAMPVLVVATPDGIAPVNLLTALARLAVVVAFEDLVQNPFIDFAPNRKDEVDRVQHSPEEMRPDRRPAPGSGLARMQAAVEKAGFTLTEEMRDRIEYLSLQTFSTEILNAFTHELLETERIIVHRLLPPLVRDELGDAPVSALKTRIRVDEFPSKEEAQRIVNLMRLTAGYESALPAERLTAFEKLWESFWNPETARLPQMAPLRDPDVEARVARVVAPYRGVRVVPALFTEATIKEELAQATDPAAPLTTPEERKANAKTAMIWLRKMAVGEIPGYKVTDAEPAIRHALLSDDLAPMAIDALVHIPSREAQLDLANLAVAPDRPIPLRTQAAAALVEHIQAYGKFVTGPQADAIANTAASVEDPELRARLQAAQGVLRTDAKSTGERLKQYVPRPVAAKEEMPPKEKEEPKEKGDEKKE